MPIESTELDNAMGKVREFIRARFQIPEDDPDFDDDVHLFDYGYVDSFGAVELTSFVEKEYSIQIAPSDLVAYPLNTVREIAAFALRRRNKEI